MKQLSILRIRQDDDVQTLGFGTVFDGVTKVFEFNTLEPPWKDNAKSISCIPEGQYWVEKFSSQKYGLVFLVNNVKNRSMIEIHYGNYYDNTRGCILPGAGFTDLNKDGYLDVHTSKVTLNKLLELMPDRFILSINWL